MYAPVAHVSSRWLTVAPGAPLRVSFDQPVTAVAYGPAGHLAPAALPSPQRSVAAARPGLLRLVEVAAAARSWELLGAPVSVNWFPATVAGAVIASPRPGTQLNAASQIRLTFSAPVSTVLGSSLPTFDPAVTRHVAARGPAHARLHAVGRGHAARDRTSMSSCRGRWRSRACSAARSSPPTASAG